MKRNFMIALSAILSVIIFVGILHCFLSDYGGLSRIWKAPSLPTAEPTSSEQALRWDVWLYYSPNEAGEGVIHTQHIAGTTREHTTFYVCEPENINITPKEGYRFLYWCLNAEGTGTILQAGQEYPISVLDGADTVYAVWEKICP